MRKTTSLLLSPLVAATLAAGVGTAVADPVDVIAPYAQAAAEVSPFGTLTKAKNIDKVDRKRTGVYCLHVSDSDIDLSRSVLTATLRSHDSRRGSIRALTEPQAVCGNDPHTITVATFRADGTHGNFGFFATVQ
ncbi:hypothetical protein ABZ371_11435 [Streptomyces sp. NPDC005899]|uniref:hypothetical protein n=1 Tax=Streptomyces sp. NPDC005899 TaxID=3155716 RepID=UPI0033ECB861